MTDITGAPEIAISIKDIAQPLASFVATFCGAFLAYHLANRRERKTEVDRQFSAYNRSLAVLFDHWNGLETYRQDVVAPVAEQADGWLSAPIAPSFSWGALKFAHDEMLFLLETKRAGLFPELLLCESGFEGFVQLVGKRDYLMAKEVHPKLKEFLGKPADEAQVRAAIGADVENQLKQFWSGICLRLHEELATTKRLYDDVGDAAALTHPGRLTIKVVFHKDGKILI
jgi:hypothetical protein